MGRWGIGCDGMGRENRTQRGCWVLYPTVTQEGESTGYRKGGDQVGFFVPHFIPQSLRHELDSCSQGPVQQVAESKGSRISQMAKRCFCLPFVLRFLVCSTGVMDAIALKLTSMTENQIPSQSVTWFSA